MTAFQYFEIRPCVTDPIDNHVTSFMGEPEYNEAIGDHVHTPAGAEREAEAYRAAHPLSPPVFWTIYGRDSDGLALAIGDFKTWADADEVMNAILAPMAEARNALDHHLGEPIEVIRAKANKASAILDDVINQCSNSDRL